MTSLFVSALSEILQPYKEFVAKFVVTVTILQLLTPAILVNQIRKAKTTDGFSIIPFLGGSILSLMFVIFGQMLGDFVTVKVNMFGVIMSFIYIATFYIYTPIHKKFKVWLQIGIGVTISAILIGYATYEDPKHVEFRFGLIVTFLLYFLIASPMVEINYVIKSKSTEKLPFPILFMGFLVSLSWLIYGIILNNLFIVFQNLVAVALGGFQLSFFLIYPSKSPMSDKKTN